MPLSTSLTRRAETPDSETLVSVVVLFEQTECAHHLAVLLEPEVAGFRQQVPPVQLGIRASLLDDKDLHSKLQQLVERLVVEIECP